MFFIYFICLAYATAVGVSSSHQLGNETDYAALLAIKSQLLDHSSTGVFQSWNHSLHHCSWYGVTCGLKHSRVTVLDLHSHGLVGTISPFIGNLSFLENLALYNNSLVGHIPPELGRLFRLQDLQLFRNKISGEIPSNLSKCVKLQDISIGFNNLEGRLPVELRALPKLKFLVIHVNFFYGDLYKIITNITSLQIVSVTNNSFTGNIQPNIGNMENLSQLMTDYNEISGTIPTSILNCSLLDTLQLTGNKLHGTIPQQIGLRLPYLVTLELSYNQLSGTFPNSLFNLTSIEFIGLCCNTFVGIVPSNFGNLQNLTGLNLVSNYFKGDINFIDSLVNCTNLQLLQLSENDFTGIIPASVANLSTSLWALLLRNTAIHRQIPNHISNLQSLRLLQLENNNLVGSIPFDLGKLQYIEEISLHSNQLMGNIPESLQNLSRLSDLYLDDNRLEGSIPAGLGDCQSLLVLNLSKNHLNGTLELLKGSTLFLVVDLYENRLEGSIPPEIGNQINLVEFSVFNNSLSGVIPDDLGKCFSLQTLNMQDNLFHGVIPTSFRSLGSLQFVDLSKNNLSGKIPNFFSNFSQLQALNLSYNNLVGEVPTTGVFAKISKISLDGNIKLCGGIPKLRLPKCKIRKETKQRRNQAIKWIVSIICALVGVLIITAWLYLCCHRKKRTPTTSDTTKEVLMKVSYDMLHKATDGFSLDNIVGVGGYGSVFRGTLNGDTVAIKVLNLKTRGASKSFIAECKALRNVRHRNLVGIITACSSIDHQRNDFKALVYEFMPNGSLDGRLHGNGVQNITLLQRVDIAIDVAHALSYLHHDCEIPVVHCDLKATNVLLDEDMVARVGDFGIAKFLAHPQHPNQSSSLGVRGTVGYTAPEYGLGSEPCIDGDIYSYGILVLELMTGKRPTDNMFQEDYNLHSYTEAALPGNILEIVDPTLLEENIVFSAYEVDDTRATVNQATTNRRRYECMVEVMSVGVGCSRHLPQDRMKIKEAISKLQSAKDNLGNGRQNRNHTTRGQYNDMN